MTKLLVVLLISLIVEAIGVVLLSKGLKQIPSTETITMSQAVKIVRAGITNHNILSGVFFEALYFGCLLYLMSRTDVTFIWPLTALGFVIMTFCAKIFLNEQVSRLRWVGVIFIVIGAGVITFSEKLKEAEQKSGTALRQGGENGMQP